MKYLVHIAAALILELDHDFHHQIDVTKEPPASLLPSLSRLLQMMSAIQSSKRCVHFKTHSAEGILEK